MSHKTALVALGGASLGFVLGFITRGVTHQASVVPAIAPIAPVAASPPPVKTRDERIQEIEAARTREILANRVSAKDLIGANVLSKLRTLRNSPLRAQYEFFGLDGNLTNQTIQQSGMTTEESLRVQKLLSALLERTKSLSKANLQEDPIRSDAGKGIRALKIAPFESEIAPDFDGFAAELVKIVGKERAADLMTSMPADRYFGAFGLYDVLIQIRTGEPPAGFSPVGDTWAEMETRDATSGKSRSTSRGPARMILPRAYPGLFDEETGVPK